MQIKDAHFHTFKFATALKCDKNPNTCIQKQVVFNFFVSVSIPNLLIAKRDAGESDTEITLTLTFFI